jgi:hypothetical protein
MYSYMLSLPSSPSYLQVLFGYISRFQADCIPLPNDNAGFASIEIVNERSGVLAMESEAPNLLLVLLSQML